MRKLHKLESRATSREGRRGTSVSMLWRPCRLIISPAASESWSREESIRMAGHGFWMLSLCMWHCWMQCLISGPANAICCMTNTQSKHCRAANALTANIHSSMRWSAILSQMANPLLGWQICLKKCGLPNEPVLNDLKSPTQPPPPPGRAHAQASHVSTSTSQLPWYSNLFRRRQLRKTFGELAKTQGQQRMACIFLQSFCRWLVI